MKNIFLAILTLTVLIPAVVFGQIDRSIQPQPGKPPSISLPSAQRTSLDNGMAILLVEHHELPVVQLQLVLRAGADKDPAGKAGLASLTADLLDEGTASRTALQISDEIDFLGANLGTSANFDGSFVTLQTLREHLEKAAAVMADVVIQPSFPSTEFDRLKSELLTDLQQQKDEPGAVATRIFYDKVYSEGHPYRYQETGTEATVQGLSPDDVKAFYRAAYAPTNATLVFVGDLTMADAVKIANDFFGKWQKKNVQPAAIPASGMGRSLKFYLIDKPGAAQSQIRIGNVAVPRNSEDYFAVSLLQQILGSSNGRLFLNLRESHGYTYGAYAQFNMRRAAGPFMAYAGVKSEITDSAMIEFMKELKRVREELVPEEEFTMYKNAVIQRLPRIFETPTQISGQLGSVVLYDLPDDYFNSLVERYQAVTREDVQRVARKYITPEALTIVVVGDAAQITGKLNALGYGTIVPCDLDGVETGQ